MRTTTRDFALGVAHAAFNREVQRRQTNVKPFLAGMLAVEVYDRRHQIGRLLRRYTAIEGYHS